jgi:putative ABC transport system permease protein
MHVLWFEFMLSLRRLARRKTQNGLLMVTFAVSLTLSLLSWSLFHTVFLSTPDFDPKGEYLVLSLADGKPGASRYYTVAEIEAIRANKHLFADFAEVGLYLSVFVRTPDGAERSLAGFMSAHALQVVGAKPLLGRLFTVAEDKIGTPPVALLSQRMWETNYGSDPHVVGRTLQASGDVLTIVGVMPESFRFPNNQDLWQSMGEAGDEQRWPLRNALVKLAPGISRERAERDLQVILQGLGPNTPANQNALRPVLLDFRDVYLQSDVKICALLLFGLSLIFVTVGCANAANLMLIDFLGRRAEVASALALGIPRVAAIRGVVFQVAVIAAGAALLSIAILPIAGPLLYSGIRIVNGPVWMRYSFEWNDVGMALALTGIAGVVTLIAPVAYLLLVDPEGVMRAHSSSSRTIGRGLWRRVLMIGQIALLTVLGISSGLLVRSSYQVGESHWGYAADRIFLGKVSTLAIDYGNRSWGPPRLVTHRKVLEQITLRTETVAAAFSDEAPAYSQPPNCTYALDPGAFTSQAELGKAFSTRVTEGFFETMDVPFVMGKGFPKDLPADGPDYVIINESLARKLWPGQDPLQRTLFARYQWMKDSDPPRRQTVYGVVRDYQASGPMAKTNDLIFSPFTPKFGAGSTVFYFVRDRAGLPKFRSLDEAVHRADPRVSLYFPSTIAEQINMTLSSIRLTAHLTTVFALAAVLLCAIGVYSLTVAQVLQSSREFGIRMALGAEPRRLWRDFTRGHLIAALVGVVLGLIGASQIVRVLGALLYGVDPRSAVTYVGVALTILVVAALACIPSLFRLKRINPADCLRSS